MHTKAAVFDFDGVISDSEPAHERSAIAAFAAMGLELTHEENMARYIGLDDRDLYRALCRDREREATAAGFEEFDARKWAAMRREIEMGGCPIFEGVHGLVRACAGAAPVAICSGARRREVEAILRIAGLLELFAVIVTADDVATAKPDPTGYRLAAAKLGLEPAACCTIEDTDKGIAAAKAAGYRAIGVMHTLPRERLHAADLVLAHIREAKPEHFGLR